MQTKIDTIEIEGGRYVPETEAKKLAEPVDGLQYVVCRTYSAGVHIGYLYIKDGQSVILKNSRRLWKWEKACSLSQVAMDGVGGDTRLAMVLPEITIEQVIEIIPCSEKAKACIEGWSVWQI